MTLTIEGTQMDVLKAIGDIQDKAAIDTVEDIQLAEAVELDVNMVKKTLENLESEGYVKLDEVETLSGAKYIISLTSKGEAVLETAK